jgi:acetyl-CoA C-acetyltransferase
MPDRAAMPEPVLLSAVRTPVGRFLGGLAPLSATALGALAVAEAVSRSGLDPDAIDEIIMGNVVTAGLGQNPARQAAIGAGIPPAAAALTINKVCGSGLKAIALAAQAIRTGDAEALVAGGMESMSNCPYLLTRLRDGYRLGNGPLVDSMIRDGLWDAYEDFHMGCTGEIVTDRYRIDREDQDRFALTSHRRAVAAAAEGRFDDELLAVSVPGKRGPVTVDADECPRPDTSLEALAALAPVFREGGTITAGNAPGVNDGAAAVVVTSESMARRLGRTPLGRIVGQAVSGVEPSLAMMAPVPAIRKLIRRLGWKLDEVGLIELNEAFAAQALAVIRELELDPARVNVNGGAVAIGHPIGASGARILVTLVHEMRRRSVEHGIAALCLGGGNAVALAVTTR